MNNAPNWSAEPSRNCDECGAAADFYVLEWRHEPSARSRLLCAAHARPILEGPPTRYARAVYDTSAGESPPEFIAHTVGMLAIPFRDYPCAVYLDRLDGPGTTLFIIGQTEARGISAALLDPLPDRPSTYRAMNNVIEALGASLYYVVVDDLDLASRTYHAKLGIETKYGETPPVDVRPSDAIALAITCDVPIYVLSSVIAKAERDLQDAQRAVKSEDNRAD